MENKFEKLTFFFEKVKDISFWDRVFRWKFIRSLSYDAYEEFKAFCKAFNSISIELEQSKTDIVILKKDEAHASENLHSLETDILNLRAQIEERNTKISQLSASIATKDETIRQHEGAINKQESRITFFETKIEEQNDRISGLDIELTTFKQNENQRKIDYEKSVATLNEIRTHIEGERKKEVETRQSEQLLKIQKMKESWAKHQDKVRSVIKNIC